MNENKDKPGSKVEGPAGAERQNDELDIGNELSMGSASGSGVSDFNPEKDFPETEEKEHQESGGGSGDDSRSDDNGINPSPGEADPTNKTTDNDFNIENADQDEQNPYPDELKINSTWMVSGQNKKI